MAALKHFHRKSSNFCEVFKLMSRPFLRSADYYSYSNPRLHQEHVFFLVDNRREPVRTASGRADESSGGTEGSEGDQNQPNGPNGTAEGSGENNQEDGEGVAGTVNIGHGIQAWPASGADANNSHRRKTTRKSTRSHGDSAASEDPETADSESTDTATYGNEEPDDTTARPVGSHGGADGSGAEGSPDFDESDSESPIPAVDEYGNPLEPESTPETELGNGGDHGRHRTTKRGNRLTTEEPGEESTSADGTEETDSEDTEDHTTSEPVEGSPEGEDDGESTISPSKISTEAVSEGAGEESDTKNDSTSPEPSEDPPVEGSTESSNGETEETYGTAEAEGVTESAGGDGSGPKETGDQSDPTKDRTEIPDRETIENSDAAGANGKLESESNGGAAGGEGGLEAAGTPGETCKLSARMVPAPVHSCAHEKLKVVPFDRDCRMNRVRPNSRVGNFECRIARQMNFLRRMFRNFRLDYLWLPFFPKKKKTWNVYFLRLSSVI